jgi:SnoaL-like protein
MDPWTLELFDQIECMDAPAVARRFSADGRFRFGNNEPAVGREEIEQSIASFFNMIGGLRHEITGVWSGTWDGGEVKSVEAEVTYTRRDGSRTAPLPVTSTIRLGDGGIKDYRVFVDATLLFAA